MRGCDVLRPLMPPCACGGVQGWQLERESAGGNGVAEWSDAAERYMRVKCTSTGRAFHVHITVMLQCSSQMNQHLEGVPI